MTTAACLPPRAGVGLKADHYDLVLRDQPGIGWFEVHAENYMGAGGPAHHYLEKIRAGYPLSIHGVGMSIGSDGPLDQAHLQRLKTVVDRYQPHMVSEHLAWSSHNQTFFNDLLPLPYNQETLQQVCDHIDQVQNTLGRTVLLENPSTYVTFNNSTIPETDFIAEMAKRTGCGLLLDVNNVFVSATNHGYQPLAYIDAFALDRVQEIHLGGHTVDHDDAGEALLIDSHDRAVTDEVWRLFQQTIDRCGPVPTLIEWDAEIPEWTVLYEEARTADRILADNHRTDTQQEALRVGTG